MSKKALPTNEQRVADMGVREEEASMLVEMLDRLDTLEHYVMDAGSAKSSKWYSPIARRWMDE